MLAEIKLKARFATKNSSKSVNFYKFHKNSSKFKQSNILTKNETGILFSPAGDDKHASASAKPNNAIKILYIPF